MRTLLTLSGIIFNNFKNISVSVLAQGIIVVKLYDLGVSAASIELKLKQAYGFSKEEIETVVFEF